MEDKKIEKLIESCREEFTAMLARWVKIPSVESEAQPGMPFGPEIARMVETAKADIEAMGFPVRTYDGYALDATLGDESLEKLAILAHLDVVPAGDGWKVDPFGAVIEGDRMYGRGTNDDKGPALCALFAMKAIREAGIPLRRAVRLILGTDEESGWADMKYYCAHAEMPEMGFSPDASFPLINTEKGMVHLLAKAPLAKEGLQVLSLRNGERMNVIPGESRAVVAGGAEIVAKTEAFAKETGLDVKAVPVEDGVELVCVGIPGHSAYPENCRNANGMLLLLLKALGVQGALRTLADAYPMEYDGRSLGIACRDEVSGALTCNMGILHVEDGYVKASFDCRCPLCADLDATLKSILAHLPGFEAVDPAVKPPHHVPADGELVSSLLAAYTEETGLSGEAQSTGGGTYAKVLKSGVAFGAAFPDDEDLAHQAGEYVYISKMMTAIRIYASAILKLCAA